MAGTLNQAETAQLLEAVSVLTAILREGYNPADEQQSAKGRQIKTARDGVRTVVTMKGNYPA